MALFNTTGFTRGVTKLGTAVGKTVQPVANILEMATESSLVWSQAHSANLVAKANRDEQVRAQTNKDLLRQALNKADQATIDTNTQSREVEMLVKLDSAKARVHKGKLEAISNISDETITGLMRQNNLTDSDILKAVKLGTVAVATDDLPKSNFDIQSFTSK